jgi:enamine deaminase RidA (YjgF/YER057c/UK114 family)
MRKTIINPAAGERIGYAQETETEPAYAEGVAVETPEYTRVFLAGLTSRDPELDMKGQTRDTLEQIEANLESVGGSMDDVVRVRVYVREPHLTEENFQAIHEARGEFFDADHYPASTLVEVSDLVREGKLIEIDSEAIVPKGEWKVETLE